MSTEQSTTSTADTLTSSDQNRTDLQQSITSHPNVRLDTQDLDAVTGYTVSLLHTEMTAVIEARDEMEAETIASELQGTEHITVNGVPVSVDVYETTVDDEFYDVKIGDVVRRHPDSDTRRYLVEITDIETVNGNGNGPSDLVGEVLYAQSRADVVKGETVTFSPADDYEHVERR